MPISITLRGGGPDSAGAVAAVEESFAILREVDTVFSTHRPESEISRLRRGELDLAGACPQVREVLELCALATELTDGWFSALLPAPDGERVLDPTGLVKGWAMERACRPLARLDGLDYCLNAGGDIAVGGTVGGIWRLGIEDPRDRTRVGHVVVLARGGMATSGTAARGAHLVDPATGERVTRAGSVTVVGPSPMWADVWATALFVAPADLAHRLPAGDGYSVIRL
ncbi:MAG TPA: FAD:protein FMN transferase [Candidatus Lustribacter sp.]|nr:FAD:protein FMN transferase [Candidatus Lustribacter sp.]